MSHPLGREFRFLYLWLKAMLRRVSQRSLGLSAKGALRGGAACSTAESARGTKPSNDQAWGSLGSGGRGLAKGQHGMWILCCKVDPGGLG